MPRRLLRPSGLRGGVCAMALLQLPRPLREALVLHSAEGVKYRDQGLSRP